ncbi:30S ribosomal protein S1 [Viridibacillus sp. FSL R5-0477]|uniref:30S ribosomal protein S1 n=1 Tax=Viridibacillus arenosi FSL R5-213 TaxID=1227360 RepID=W4EKR6_9BACL|nr:MULTISPECIES: 30S ribosomal protein S1 [Viridibacillus]ETT81160.1 30S ribosomal protein S1 [Viridibacillus arenosi FSL R5-213]OMC88626.1 30S ribosomal protein S1 [Viridibacillus sp. FSL H7-0596]OMC93259.1 30S ribosomal protein S1 [Viridibacillus arenosi]
MSEEMNLNQGQEFREGDIVKGIVAQVEEKAVTVSIEGAPFDGVVPISELSSLHVDKASDAVSVGDEFELIITKVEEENYVLSKRRVDAIHAWKVLTTKFENGEVIESEVKDVVKGGLVVDLGVRGFVPASLVEDHFVESFEDYKGRTMAFKIVEMDQQKNRLILSHRAIVEGEKASKKEQLLGGINEGDVIEGTVQRLASFGAFIDLGGVDGLVHISQVSHGHVENVSDVLSEGQKVTVKVLSVDKDNERISLSIKDTLPGPWEEVEVKAQKGAVLTGTVKRLVNFGAFVEVFPGVEGLVHISQIAHKHITTPHEVLKEGQEVEVKVLDVNKNESRLSLSIKALLENAEEEDYTDYELPEETSGFSFADVIGDKLKNFSE